MKNSFFQSLTTKDLRTENGMPTHSSSGSFVVDFFYKMGGQRAGREPWGNLIGLFYAALGEDANLTVKALFNLRDPRGGMGERMSGRVLWNSLAKSHPRLVLELFRKIPEFGRWDDILCLLDTPVEEEVMKFILESLNKGDKLCAKWMPRENKSHGDIAIYLAERWGISRKEYRQRLAKISNTVEQQMCQNLWEDIIFKSVPSQAMRRYRKAFQKHQEDRFTAYLEAVKSGTETIKTATLSPVEIVHEYMSKGFRYDEVLELLWTNLPDTVPGNVRFLPIPDVSGSMNGKPMEVSLALGIYLAQRNKSIFKDGMITFSQTPTFVYLTGKSLVDNLQITRKMTWGMNTNLEAVFELILSSAIKAKLSEDEMPTHLMIISDMQFDQAVRNDSGYNTNAKNRSYSTERRIVKEFSPSVMEMIDKMYAEAGYKRPNIFFWNVSNSTGVPAKVDENGVGLISGFSPNLLTSVLSGDLNPINQVRVILNNGRYDFVNGIV